MYVCFIILPYIEILYPVCYCNSNSGVDLKRKRHSQFNFEYCTIIDFFLSESNLQPFGYQITYPAIMQNGTITVPTICTSSDFSFIQPPPRCQWGGPWAGTTSDLTSLTLFRASSDHPACVYTDLNDVATPGQDLPIWW